MFGARAIRVMGRRFNHTDAITTKSSTTTLNLNPGDQIGFKVAYNTLLSDIFKKGVLPTMALVSSGTALMYIGTTDYMQERFNKSPLKIGNNGII